jgi:hypothetical protein
MVIHANPVLIAFQACATHFPILVHLVSALFLEAFSTVIAKIK